MCIRDSPLSIRIIKIILETYYSYLTEFYPKSKGELIYGIPYTPHGTRIPHTVVKTVVTYTPIDYELGVHITLSCWFY